MYQRRLLCVFFKRIRLDYNSGFQNNYLTVHRSISSSPFRFEKESLVEEVADYYKDKRKSSPVKVDERVPVKAKLPLSRRIINEVVHYWNGFRLFFRNVNICSKLVAQRMSGAELSRREQQLLYRTLGDIFRLVPFTIFIIIPFSELLLPVVIKFCPWLLPSTFNKEDPPTKKSLRAKLELARFLQQTLEQIPLLQAERKSSSNVMEEFNQFIDRVRGSGIQPTLPEILKFSKMFEDHLTLETLTRAQLAALCRLLQIRPFGHRNLLIFQLEMKLRSLHADDVLIARDGIDSLSLYELQEAVRERGMRAYGVSAARLQSQLEQWIQLHVEERVPLSLLLLSRTLYLPETLSSTDKLIATLSQLPEKTTKETVHKLTELEGKLDNTARLEALKREVEAIKAEKEENTRLSIEEEAEQQRLISNRSEKILDDALHDRLSSNIESEIAESEKAPVKAEVISKAVLKDIEEVMSDLVETKTKVIEERDDLEELKEDFKEYKEDVELLSKVEEVSVSETRAAKRLANYVTRMVGQLDSVLKSLETEQDTIRQKISRLEKSVESGAKDVLTKLDKKKRTLVSISEVKEALSQFRSVPDKELHEKLAVILDDDKDGLIDAEKVIDAVELLAKNNVALTPKQFEEVIRVISKEEEIKESHT